MKQRITLSLISHTNVGKTTLARTLLRRDVGQVRDQAHVTDVSEAHTLIETDRALLQLWDTPGFGDTRKLLQRLRREKDPLGWFLHQVWDRFLDRALWCSQEAVRNIKEEADVVLYLVNASEDPQDAGYVPLELELLAWMERPVVLLLNQSGDGEQDLESAWRAFGEGHAVVREVLSLDAFVRGWPEESVLLERVIVCLPQALRETMRELARVWNERNLAVFRDSCGRMAQYLVATAVDREAPEGPAEMDGPRGTARRLADALKFDTLDKRRASALLNRRLDERTESLMDRLISLHELEGKSGVTIEERVREFQVRRGSALNETSGAVAGAVLSGALGGLAADALSGGLSLGGGMIAGGILGALGGSALARGYRMVGTAEQPSVRWAPGFLDELSRQVLLRYLAVAHFGRGSGAYDDRELPGHWADRVDTALGRHGERLRALWDRATVASTEGQETLGDELRSILDAALRSILAGAYPAAAGWLESDGGDV